VRAVGTLALLAVGALGSGCELVFPPGGQVGDDGVTPDGPPVPLQVDADVVALCPGQTAVPYTLSALADAEISSGDPTTAFGALDTARIDGGSAPSHGLFKFDTTAWLVFASEPAELRLALHSANRQDSCGGTCGECNTMEAPGVLAAYVADSDWVEDEVTWSHKANGGETWAGADAPGIDRGNDEIRGGHTKGGVTEFVFSGPAAVHAWAWIGVDGNPLDRLSFMVKSYPQVVMMASTREGTQTSCAAGDVTATLVAYVCE